MLTDIACRALQPEATDRKHRDTGGLFLLVTAKGFKSWRLKYHFGGKEKQLVLGSYPRMGLKQAREARDQAKDLLRNHIDPAAEKQRLKRRAYQSSETSFRIIAERWHTAQLMRWTPRYARQVLDRLKENVYPQLGKEEINAITPADVLAVLRPIEARGAHEMTQKVRMHMSDVFGFALAQDLCISNPAEIVRKALTHKPSTKRPAYLNLKLARRVLIGAETMTDAWWATLLSSRLIALTAARPDIVRQAVPEEFEDLDGKEPIWRVPAARMKLKRKDKADASFDFVIPLSSQAVEVVKAALAARGNSHWLFPSHIAPDRPMSNATLSKLYRDLGHQGKHVPHGWRATFSTVMNERAARQGLHGDREVIDLMLAHMKSGVEAAYNRAAYMPRRRELAQLWADLLMEGLPPAASLLPPSA